MFEVTTRRQAFITQQNVKSVAYFLFNEAAYYT